MKILSSQSIFKQKKRPLLRKYFGPSTLVTAAFIGPGTLTVCTLSGATNGYSLLWVLVLATVTTIALQEMAARLGLVTQKGLGEAIRSNIDHPLLRAASVALVFTAIIIGNAAYEAGNISGAALGLEGVFGTSIIWPMLIGLVSAGVLFVGKSKVLEGFLICLVILMSLVFILTAILVKPNLGDLLGGLVPSINSSNQLAVMALIGTTIVPYNLFLHAASVKTKWTDPSQMNNLRIENTISIGLGGIISLAIVITSASTIYGTAVGGMSEMALQLEPLLGSWARYFLGAGLFAAGISSSITAPLAAAYTAKGIFGWDNGVTDYRFRIVWMVVLISGIGFSVSGFQSISIIQVAQIANGLLLPVIVFFLMVLSNKKKLLGDYVNKTWQNMLGVLVLFLSLLISLRILNSVFDFL